MKLLEDAPASMPAVKAREPHFKVFSEFKDASYGKRYEILLTKLVRERLYDSACFLLSNAKTGTHGDCREPAPELTFEKFLASLLARATALAKTLPLEYLCMRLALRTLASKRQQFNAFFI